MCRSLLEKSVDDWLAQHGVAHKCEPRYPRHPELNPRGSSVPTGCWLTVLSWSA
jgi:hypothetical protein